MKAFDEKITHAAEMYLKRRDYEILDTNWHSPDDEGGFELIAKDEDALVFVTVIGRSSGNEFPESRKTRQMSESLAAQYLKDAPDDLVNIPFRFDVISLLVIAESRALIRHHINSLGCSCNEDFEEDE